LNILTESAPINSSTTLGPYHLSRDYPIAEVSDYKIARLPNSFMNGVLIVDKPAGLTSHDVVNRVRRILHERSVGHLGTLDPMATGVLPLVTGTLTRLAQFYTASEKTYEGTVRFGFATDTYDAAGEPTSAAHEVRLDAEQVEELATGFRGVIEQIPPPFSAKKINGVPAYKLARQLKQVVLKPVQVEIKEFVILGVEVDRALFRARVASGTYMRSVAHEMGRELGCGAHLESLRRTSVAEFTLEDAHTLERLAAEAANPGTLQEYFVHPRQLRDRRRSHGCPHPQRTHCQPARTFPRSPGQSIQRAKGTDRHCHPCGRNTVSSKNRPVWGERPRPLLTECLFRRFASS
jgi:tRNA pseudouridine55 synthase